MDENKNVNTEVQNDEIMVNGEKLKKKFKLPKLKNKAAFKRGTYSVIITAVVLIGIIAFNVLISALSNRFMLVYDMTSDKVNTISDDNIKYIKEIDKPVKVIVCAKDNQYTNNMVYYAQEYGIYDNSGAYSDAGCFLLGNNSKIQQRRASLR